MKVEIEKFEGIPIKKITVESDLLRRIPKFLREIGIKKRLTMICDQNTYDAAGKKAASYLTGDGFEVAICVLESGTDRLIPDERALGEIEIGMDQESELLLAVGSGTLNDLTRYTSFKTGIPYGIVATAPSMDGYTSSVSPLIVNGFKRTYNAVYPEIVIGDTDILAKAPHKMVGAGFGDILGKYTSLADWKLGAIVNGEEYSREIAGMVETSLKRSVDNVERIGKGDIGSVGNVMGALILSGIAMLKFGNSRPASGAEHHISHYLEMKNLMDGKIPELHGISVGVATTIVTGIYHRVFSLNVDDVKNSIAGRKPESHEEYEKRIESAYGPIAGEVFADLGNFYNDESKRAKRQKNILDNWENLKIWVERNVPKSDRIIELLKTAGSPSDLKGIGVEDSELKDIVTNAREVRKRYTIFRLADDIGLSPEFLTKSMPER